MLNTALIWTFDSIAPSPVFNRTWHTWAGFVNQPLVPALPVEVEEQFYYATNDGVVTITGYTGPGGPLTISSTVGGLPVAGIGDFAFYHCHGLTSITIPNSVTNIGAGAFQFCSKLASVYFQGNAPSADLAAFSGDNNATVYYLPGAGGWGPTLAGRPAVRWNPQAQTSDAIFALQTKRFGFTIIAASNLTVVVEATTNLANSIWSPLQTNTFTSGSVYFIDPQWTNYPARFYRLRWP